MRAALTSLAVLSLGLSACSGEDGSPNAPWRVMTSSDSTGAVVGAFLIRDGVGPERESTPPSLLVRCEAGAPSVYVDWRAELEGDPVTVTYALGDAPERTEQWAASADGQAAGRWTRDEAVPLIQAMLRHDRMRISAETASGPETWDFPLDGFAEASEVFRDACDVPATEGG